MLKQSHFQYVDWSVELEFLLKGSLFGCRDERLKKEHDLILEYKLCEVSEDFIAVLYYELI